MAVPLSRKALAAIVAALPLSDRDVSFELLDIGFSSVVVAFGSSVVRVARTGQAKEGHEREARLLPWLKGRLSVALPVPITLLAPGADLPFGAIVQPRLPGRVMTAEDGGRSVTTADFGRVLALLHGQDYDEAPAGSIQHLDPARYVRRIERETNPLLRGRLSSREWTKLTTRLDDAQELSGEQDRALCHGDAWFGNVLVGDDDHVTALLDFEDACLADRALDLAATMSLDPPGPDRLLDAYFGDKPPSSSLSARIDVYVLLRELAGLAYVLRNEMEEELEYQLQKVRAAVDHET
ncbi:MAG: aminoglycoside phosphotransferase family protein [Actinomycetota bacterium]|nr:aminoglycoside phosphotransferase family protein [Actinomycetota bacterium]